MKNPLKKSAKSPRSLGPRRSVRRSTDRALGAQLSDFLDGFGSRCSRISRRRDKWVEDQAVLTSLWGPVPFRTLSSLASAAKRP